MEVCYNSRQTYHCQPSALWPFCITFLHIMPDDFSNLSSTNAPLSAPSEQAGTACAVPLFSCIAIIGVGMMGGSLGLAIRKAGAAQRVLGVDTRADILERATALGVIEEGTMDLRAGVADADCVLLAAPVKTIPHLLEALVPLVPPQTLLSDIGSAKQHIVTAGERYFGERFVGGHPMAGSPQGGVEAALPDLFRGAAWAIVRSEIPDLSDLSQDAWAMKLQTLVQALGACPVGLDSARHDTLVALVSHLPHVLSFAFADMIAESSSPEMAERMAGSSYRDMLRVSGSDRAFWQDIFQDNREAVLQALDAYEAQFRRIRQSIVDGEIPG